MIDQASVSPGRPRIPRTVWALGLVSRGSRAGRGT